VRSAQEQLDYIKRACAKAEVNYQEMVERTDNTSHPDDKARIAAVAAKMFTKFQTLQTLCLDLEDE